MIQKAIFLILFGFFSLVHGEDLRSALSSLKESPLGFCFVDLGMTPIDLADFDAMDVERECFFHQFGNFSEVEVNLGRFLTEMGKNESHLVAIAASRLTQIANEVMAASGEETAWVHLRASVPTNAYNLPRWHMDGAYFSLSGPERIMYKFAVTLKGASTLFYPLPKELRQMAWRNMRQREVMAELFPWEMAIIPKLGEGALFIGGKMTCSALHTEPPIHENRLFFSIVPCNQTQLLELKKQILAVYPAELRIDSSSSSGTSGGAMND